MGAQRHCVVQLDTAGRTVRTMELGPGREWTGDWSEAVRACGELSSLQEDRPDPAVGGYEVVTEEA